MKAKAQKWEDCPYQLERKTFNFLTPSSGFCQTRPVDGKNFWISCTQEIKWRDTQNHGLENISPSKYGIVLLCIPDPGTLGLPKGAWLIGFSTWTVDSIDVHYCMWTYLQLQNLTKWTNQPQQSKQHVFWWWMISDVDFWWHDFWCWLWWQVT